MDVSAHSCEVLICQGAVDVENDGDLLVGGLGLA